MIKKSQLPLHLRARRKFQRTVRKPLCKWRFYQSLRRFLKDDRDGKLEDAVLTNLVESWDNVVWSAQQEYLRACLEHASSTPGPILECGSGLSTVLTAIIAKRRKIAYWVLEHDPVFAGPVRHYLGKYQLSEVHYQIGSLVDYGAYEWYDDALLRDAPKDFSLVTCDGPPAETKGGRYGLLPVVRHRMAPGCVILLDDAAREGEQAVARRWEREEGVSHQVRGVIKPYMQMVYKNVF